MEKKKIFSKHGVGARVLSFLLAFAMVVTMGAFSQIGQIAAKADDLQSPIVVKNADGTYDVTFYTDNSSATQIQVAGDITNWQSGAVSMQKTEGTTIWSATISNLASGKHEYKFIEFIENGVNWYKDPLNQGAASDGNSPLILSEDPIVTENEDGTFDLTLFYTDVKNTATEMHVMGDGGLPGTTWDPSTAVSMTKKNGSNIWSYTFSKIAAGTYSYKFNDGTNWLPEGAVGNLSQEVGKVEAAYTLVGTLPGINWDNNSSNNFVLEEGTTYTYEISNVPAGRYEYQVLENHSWDKKWGNTNDNLIYTLSAPADLLIKIDTADKSKVDITPTYLKALVVDNGQIVRGIKTKLSSEAAFYDGNGGNSTVIVDYKLKDAIKGVTLENNVITIDSASEITEVTVIATYGDFEQELTIPVVGKQWTVTFHMYLPDVDTADTADIYVFENGGGQNCVVSLDSVVTDTVDSSIKWLTGTAKISYNSLGIIGRPEAGSWAGQDGNRYYVIDENADAVELWYVFGETPVADRSLAQFSEARYINFEYVNPSLDDTAAPEFYSWTVGGVNNSKLIAMEKQADGVWSARVKVSSTCDKVDFVVALDSKADPWVKDGGDHSIAFPLTQKNLFVKMESGKEPVLSAPLNTGYEINAAEGKVNFYYRDDAALTNGTLADMTVKVEAGAESYDMTYVPGNKRFEVALPLANGKTYYRYLVNGEHVTDAFNANTEEKNGTTYSYLEYYKLDATITASVMNDKFNYNENNVVKLNVVQNKNGEEPDLKVTEASIDVSALGGSSALKIEPELMAVAISATTDTALGVKTLPIAVKDQFGNTYTAEAKVELAAREKSSAADDFDWDESIIYFMVTDRFFDGNNSNNTANGENTYGDNDGLYHGGDFAGVTAKLDYLKDLGINTIWITPIVENIPGVTVTGTGSTDVPYNAAYHGYWASDFTKLNPALGTDEELKTMIAEAHKRGIKIMVDIVVNHAGYGTEDSFNALLDGKDMIRGTEDTVSGSDQKDSLSGLPDFKTEDADVRALLVKWQTEWVKNFGIDYFRVDTVKHVEGTTWAALKNALTEIDPEFKMIGEYAGGGYAGNGNTLGTGEMDSVLDFDFNDWATNFVSGKISDVEASMTARNEKLNNTYMTGQFLGSHDEDGFKYNLINNKNMTEENAQAAALVAASLQITAKGQPVIYYGEEIGLTGANNYPYQTNRYDFDWSLVTDSNKTYQHYKKMLAIRNAYTDVFARGTRTTIAASDTEGTDVFERAYNGQKLIVALNIGAQEKQVALSGLVANTTYRDVYSGKDYMTDGNGALTIAIPAAADGGTVVLAKGQTKQPEDEKKDVVTTQPKQPVVKKNVKANVSKNAPNAKVTTTAKGKATLTTLGKTKKPTVWIHSKVTIDGVDYNITAIGKKAFAQCGKATWKITIGKGVRKINAKAFTGSKITLVDIYETKALTVSTKAFAGVNTKAMTIRVTKNMSKKEFKKLTKQLRAAGFKGNILQMKYH